MSWHEFDYSKYEHILLEIRKCCRSGRMESVANVAANQIITLQEGQGIVARQPFSR
jgi:hypothetical protein